MRFLRRFRTPPALPHRCFISHSYRDESARARLLRDLPHNVEPFVFPEIHKVRPDQMVSSELVSAILGCDGLIYLRGGHSADSFWVAFERDYALRAGKLVFSYDPQTRALTRDTSPPLDLAAFANYAHADTDRVGPILLQMRQQRFFDLPLLDDDLAPGANFSQSVQGTIARVLDRGGYVVAFWSMRAAQSQWVRLEYETALQRDPAHFSSHIFFARLDDTPLPISSEYLRRYDQEEVRFFDTASGSYLHHIDNLIVRLYWLIYRKTRQNQLQ